MSGGLADSSSIGHWLESTGKEWLRRFLFPDFSNKLTWYVVVLGAGPILTPASMQFLVFDWLVDTFSLSLGKELTLADFATSNADYWLGFGLIALALIHNIGNKWLTLKQVDGAALNAGLERAGDLELYKQLLALLPSTGAAIQTLKEHDFGNSFHTSNLDALDQFVNTWNCPERMFHIEDLEDERKLLWASAKKFVSLLASKSSPISPGLQSVVPIQHKSDWDLPDWVDAEVKAVNESATQVFDVHQKFVALGRTLLKC